MPVNEAKNIIKLTDPYRISRHECIFFPRWMCLIWPYQTFLLRIVALILFGVFINIILTMQGYKPATILWSYSSFTVTPSVSKNFSAIGGIQINVNHRKGTQIYLQPGNIQIQPNKFSLVPVGRYSLIVSAPNYTRVVKKITVSRSVVYKDYIYLIKNPVKLDTMLMLKGKYFAKLVGNRILLCDNSSVYILSPGLGRFINKLNYNLALAYQGARADSICSQVQKADYLEVVANNSGILSITKKIRDKHASKVDYVINWVKFKKGSASDYIKIPASLAQIGVRSVLKTSVAMLSTKTITSRMPLDIERVSDSVILFPKGLIISPKLELYFIDINNNKLVVQSKELDHFFGKVYTIGDDVVIFRLQSNMMNNLLEINVNRYHNADLSHISNIYSFSLPLMQLIDIGYMPDKKSLYTIDKSYMLRIFSNMKVSVDEDILLNSIKQLLAGNTLNIEQPFVFSDYQIRRNVLDFYNRLHGDNAARNKYFIPFQFIYFYRLSSTGSLERPLRLLPINSGCILCQNKVICLDTNNTTEFLPGIYNLPPLFNTDFANNYLANKQATGSKQLLLSDLYSKNELLLSPLPGYGLIYIYKHPYTIYSFAHLGNLRIPFVYIRDFKNYYTSMELANSTIFKQFNYKGVVAQPLGLYKKNLIIIFTGYTNQFVSRSSSTNVQQNKSVTGSHTDSRSFDPFTLISVGQL